jgi:hypothetical protein
MSTPRLYKRIKSSWSDDDIFGRGLESKSNGRAEREQIVWRFFFKTEQNSLISRLKLELDKEKSSTGGNNVVGRRSNEEI